MSALLFLLLAAGLTSADTLPLTVKLHSLAAERDIAGHLNQAEEYGITDAGCTSLFMAKAASAGPVVKLSPMLMTASLAPYSALTTRSISAV